MPTEASVSELRSRIAAISFNANEEFDNRDWEARDFAIADRAIAVTLDTVIAALKSQLATPRAIDADALMAWLDTQIKNTERYPGDSRSKIAYMNVRAHIESLVTGGE